MGDYYSYFSLYTGNSPRNLQLRSVSAARNRNVNATFLDNESKVYNRNLFRNYTATFCYC
jgi:hypothetical protein